MGAHSATPPAFLNPRPCCTGDHEHPLAPGLNCLPLLLAPTLHFGLLKPTLACLRFQASDLFPTPSPLPTSANRLWNSAPSIWRGFCSLAPPPPAQFLAAH